jgi:hypothetical protein
MLKRKWSALVFTVVVFMMIAGLSGPVWAQWSTDSAVNVPVVTALYDQGFVKALHDGEGGYFVIWHDKRNCDTTGRDIYAQYYNAEGVAQWAENGIAVTSTDGGQKKPDMVLDGEGGIVVAWTNSDVDHAAAQRIDASGNKLWDPEVIVIENGTECVIKCASDGAGGAIIVDAEGAINRVTKDGTLPWRAADNPIILDDNGTDGRRIISDGAGGAIVAWKESGHYDDSDSWVKAYNSTFGFRL